MHTEVSSSDGVCAHSERNREGEAGGGLSHRGARGQRCAVGRAGGEPRSAEHRGARTDEKKNGKIDLGVRGARPVPPVGVFPELELPCASQPPPPAPLSPLAAAAQSLFLPPPPPPPRSSRSTSPTRHPTQRTRLRTPVRSKRHAHTPTAPSQPPPSSSSSSCFFFFFCAHPPSPPGAFPPPFPQRCAQP